MTNKTLRLATAVLSATLLIGLSVASVSAHGQDRGRGNHDRRDLVAALAATARFHSLRQADKAGYAQPPAPAPLHECISSFDGTGAMGFHFINGGLLDTTIDPREPEVLVYAPDRHGRLHLVALEYVIFQAPWVAEHGSEMPELFGQMYMATGEPNRYDIPAFFSLHVWLWKHNPAGLFAPFNPSVSCDPGSARGHAGSRGATTASARFSCAIDRAPTGVSTGRT